MIDNDTIVAQATPPGRGGIGIIRISGLRAQNVAEIILGKLPKPRYADYLSFKDLDGTKLDRGIALWFPNPNSFTGEDVLELHSHGGSVILDILLKCILKIPDVRIANPGEFSKRAFLNNKLDLVQAEAIADLINASSEQAVRSSIDSLQGTFSTYINHLVESITNLRSYIEMTIDFPDENINLLSNKNIEAQICEIINHLSTIRNKAQQGNILREGMKIVIVGSPNVGKSSLLNALAEREVAIVTNIAGTTRDILCEHIYIDGMPLHIIDTAGLRDTNDQIESIGIARTWKEIKQADHILFIVDGTTTSEVDSLKLYSEFITHMPANLPITIVRNKIDITNEMPKLSSKGNHSLVCLSALTGAGIDILCHHLKHSIGFNTNVEGCFLARRRHLQALEKAFNHLEKSKAYLIICSFELLAEELRLAQQSLSEITGKFTSEDLLSRIFSSFCIGK